MEEKSKDLDDKTFAITEKKKNLKEWRNLVWTMGKHQKTNIRIIYVPWEWKIIESLFKGILGSSLVVEWVGVWVFTAAACRPLVGELRSCKLCGVAKNVFVCFFVFLSKVKNEGIIAEKFPNLDKDVDIQLMELIRHPTIFNAKRPSSRHIIIKQMKNQK